VKREIQVANVNLAPEILDVFASSMIFHDHKPFKTKASPSPQPLAATFSIGSSKVDKSKLVQINEEELLQRLEEQGNDKTLAIRKSFLCGLEIFPKDHKFYSHSPPHNWQLTEKFKLIG